MYTIINSVFSTLITCNEAPYLSNAMENSDEAVKVVSFQSVISLVFTMAAAIVVPQLISTIGTTKEGWSIIAIMLVVPFTLIGLLRFAFIKEVRSTTGSGREKVNLKAEIGYLFKNK